MKIAFLISGYIGGLTGKNLDNKDLDHQVDIARYCKKTTDMFFSEHEIDYYLHSWQPLFKDELIEIFNPKASIFLDQIDFSGEKYNEYAKDFVSDKYRPHLLSRWYGQKQVCDIFSAEGKKKSYDYVIISRYDISWNKKVEIDKSKLLLATFSHFNNIALQKHDQLNVEVLREILKKYPRVEARALVTNGCYAKRMVPDHILGVDPMLIEKFSNCFENLKNYQRISLSSHTVFSQFLIDIGVKQKDVNLITTTDQKIGIVPPKGTHYDIFRFKYLKSSDLLEKQKNGQI